MACALPFFLSGVLFITGIFAVFAPVPLLLLSGHKDRKRLWLAVVINSAVVLIAGGRTSLVFFGIFVLTMAISLPVFLRRCRSVERAAACTLLAMAAGWLLMAVSYAVVYKANPVTGAREQVARLVDYLSQSVSSEMRSQISSGADLEEWKKSLITEVPSAIAVFSLVLVWTSIVIMIRLDIGRIRERFKISDEYLRRWKAPEYLVWPTIASGVLLLFKAGAATDVATNIFKFLMAVYAIQGVSVLSHAFEVWNIRGLLRSIGYLLAVFIMMPLLLGLGFFDLWFDFRGKIRQT